MATTPKAVPRRGTALLTVDIRDVRDAGGVRPAIVDAARVTDGVASGIVGMEFATSGPGPGWTKQYGVDEWSREAFNGGATHYVDPADGRARESEPVDEDDEDDEDVLVDVGGCRYRVGGWSAESRVKLVCPDSDDALKYPDEAAEMAREVMKHHFPCSDVEEWRRLVRSVKAAGAAFADLDEGEFPGADD